MRFERVVEIIIVVLVSANRVILKQMMVYFDDFAVSVQRFQFVDHFGILIQALAYSKHLSYPYFHAGQKFHRFLGLRSCQCETRWIWARAIAMDDLLTANDSQFDFVSYF